MGFFSTISTAASQLDTLMLFIEIILSPTNKLAFSAGPPGETKSITASRAGSHSWQLYQSRNGIDEKIL